MSYTQAQNRVRHAMTRAAGRSVYLDTMTLPEALALSQVLTDREIMTIRNVGKATLRMIREMAPLTHCPECGRPL